MAGNGNPAILINLSMARTNPKSSGDWFDRMRQLFAQARYAAAGDVYDEVVGDGERPGADAVLLRARIFLKKGSEKVTSFLLKQRLANASPHQLARRAMYLGTGYARLGEFREADRYFTEAKELVRQGPLRAELAAHLTRRYLEEKNVTLAEEWQRKTLADRSLAGKIRSEHLRSYILARREEYPRQAESLLAVLDLIGKKRQEFLEDWYVAVYTLAVLARELRMPAAAARAKAEVDVDLEWSSDFDVQRFQAIKGVAWCQALAGDELSCLRYLRLAGHVAPSAIWRAMLFLDRSYFASTVGERQWAANEFFAAEDVAEQINWEETSGEERVALLLLAELAAVHAPERAPYYLARFNDLGRLRAHLQHLAFDDRLSAMTAFTGGIVRMAEGETEAAAQQLREAWSTFDRICYDVRAARAALALYRATRKPRWLHLAEDKLEGYPRAWLTQKLETLAAPPEPEPLKLPRMQEAVTQLVCEGLSTNAIAQQLDVSRFTVLNHLKVIYKKLGVNSREKLVVEALKRKLNPRQNAPAKTARTPRRRR
jgi:DNA-binding CsgD family transcriptional regulator